LPTPPSGGEASGAPSDRLRAANFVSAGFATLIVLIELLVTDFGLSFGASAIVSGGAIVTWTIFAVIAVGCGYLCARFLSGALVVERELNRLERGAESQP
jgi:hypothetical protein